MPTVRELNRRPISSDSRGERVAERVFIVEGAVPTAVPRDGSLTGLPGTGDTYPGEAGLVADAVAVETYGSSVTDSRVTVRYSSNRRFASRPEADETSPPFNNSITTRTINVEVEIPVVRRRNVEVGDGSSVVTTTLLEADTSIITEARTVVEATVSTSTFTLSNALAVEAETGKLHELATGRLFLFLGVTSNQVGPQDWRLTYQWEGDRGTPIPNPRGGTGWLIPISDSEGGGLYRLPHNQILYLNGTVDTVGDAVNILRFPVNATGWTTLPGGPLQ